MKNQNSKKIYLFESGIFYIFLDEDARKMSKAFNFKLTHLNESYVKCGFPANSFDKYIDLIKKSDYDVEIVNPNNNTPYSAKNYSNQLEANNLLNEIISIDMDNITPREAYAILEKLQNEVKNFMQME